MPRRASSPSRVSISPRSTPSARRIASAFHSCSISSVPGTLSSSVSATRRRSSIGRFRASCRIFLAAEVTPTFYGMPIAPANQGRLRAAPRTPSEWISGKAGPDERRRDEGLSADNSREPPRTGFGTGYAQKRQARGYPSGKADARRENLTFLWKPQITAQGILGETGANLAFLAQGPHSSRNTYSYRRYAVTRTMPCDAEILVRSIAQPLVHRRTATLPFGWRYCRSGGVQGQPVAHIAR